MKMIPDIEYELKKRSPYHIPPVHDRYERKPGENHFTYSADGTSFVLQGTGLGDLMAIRQFGRALHDYIVRNTVPDIGKIVITTGSGPPAFNPDDGDVNLYWWWSFGHYDLIHKRYLENYINKTTVEPDIILCPSKKTEKEAKQLGFDTLRFPLGTYSFEPRTNADRSGFGYAGTVNHKQNLKEEMVLGPFVNSPDFEWVDSFQLPEELNLWYNSKAVTFGLHKEAQRTWGMVNNRVFETLASGTPFVIESYPELEEILGFDYPYQTNSKSETVELVDKIVNNPEEVSKQFLKYSQKVRELHGYNQRVTTLLEHIK